MLKRDNVTLETGRIEAVTEDGIIMSDGTLHEVDVIVLATGFEIQRMLAPMEIIGRDGVVLRDLWGDDKAEAYRGIAIPGFPNFLVTPGPNSAPNHAGGQNIVAEIHAKYLVECLNMLVDQGARAFEVTPGANKAWNEAVQDELQNMIWTHPKAKSYYRNAKGRVTVSCPYRLVDYWGMMQSPKAADFRLDR
jgi:4-hydroxyacetophenone monooxygenase